MKAKPVPVEGEEYTVSGEGYTKEQCVYTEGNFYTKGSKELRNDPTNWWVTPEWVKAVHAEGGHISGCPGNSSGI